MAILTYENLKGVPKHELEHMTEDYPLDKGDDVAKIARKVRTMIRAILRRNPDSDLLSRCSTFVTCWANVIDRLFRKGYCTNEKYDKARDIYLNDCFLEIKRHKSILDVAERTK